MEVKAKKAGMIVLGVGAIGLLISMWIGCGPWSHLEGRDQTWSSWKGRHGFHGKDFPEHILKHMDERVQALNLTEGQKEQYAAIRQKMKYEMTVGQENRRRLMMSVRKEIQKDLPDIHEVAGMVSEHIGMLHGSLDKSMKLFLEFYENLDENQKAMVVEHFRDRLNRIASYAGLEKTGEAFTDDTPFPVSTWGEDINSGSLSDQMAQKRGDRHGELL